VPPATHCLDCGEPIPSESTPSRTTDAEALRSRLRTAADKAHHETVTVDTLGSDYQKYDRPLGDYLFESEQPVALFETPGVAVDGHGARTWKANAGFRQSGHFVVTDERAFVVLPGGDEDRVLPAGTTRPTDTRVVPVDYRSVVAVESAPGLLRDAVRLETADGTEYEVELGRETEEDLAVVVETLREFARERTSDESRAVRLRRDVDEAVAEGETAETLLREVADRLADSDETAAYDAAVADAESLDDLLGALQRRSTDGETGLVADRQSESPAPVPQSRANTLRQHVSRTLKDADPAEVGKYTIAAGIGFGAYAVSAPFSTAAGLAAIAAGGAATGAYASSHPHSLAAQIDPVTLATRARVRGDDWRDRPVPGEGGTGAALGTLEYLTDANLTADYARWLADVDVERVRRGAELGARAAADREDLPSTAAAAALGGGFGLAYDYVGDDQMADIERLVADSPVDAADVLDAADGDDDGEFDTGSDSDGQNE
jgi:hypothetical protein